jgi:hypothetical protein
MREYRDASNRLSVDLSDDQDDFGAIAENMISLHGKPVDKASGLDQRYWDFDVNGVTVVLHCDVFAGVSIHVEDGTHDGLLREIVGKLMNRGSQNKPGGEEPTVGPRKTGKRPDLDVCGGHD